MPNTQYSNADPLCFDADPLYSNTDPCTLDLPYVTEIPFMNFVNAAGNMAAAMVPELQDASKGAGLRMLGQRRRHQPPHPLCFICIMSTRVYVGAKGGGGGEEMLTMVLSFRWSVRGPHLPGPHPVEGAGPLCRAGPRYCPPCRFSGADKEGL